MEEQSSSSMKIILGTVLVIVLIGLGIYFNQTGQNGNVAISDEFTSQIASTSEISNQNNKMENNINQAKKYTAVLHTTVGDIAIELNAKATPITANNFITLAKKNFYNGTIFHRVIEGFMIQGGDPKGDGTGGPGYTFADEPFAGDYNRGTVAMANAGPNTNGSQFFIMHQNYPLPKNYVIFGQVVKGMEVVDKIATAPTEASPMGENSKPVNPVKVKTVEIVEK
ncbi:MAG: cyclophilin-type peptidylprolyl cis-trans isomerase, peptidylprolyl isomerase [Parcubacteria group bacterium GW2011_GWC1_43_11b]|nr:MAG: cyclophilin-type peptidylprolyl cis-trans isomerase, peptidylprolyl isomerase [Parcubacteria group bacterium GW2011_GWC1_43_11b]